MALEYGRCPCGHAYEARLVEVKFSGDPAPFRDVPQGACTNCGSRVYKRGVLERVEAIMRARSG